MSALRAAEAMHPEDALATAEGTVRSVSDLLWLLHDEAEREKGDISARVLGLLAGTLKLEADSMKRSLDALKRELENAG